MHLHFAIHGKKTQENRAMVMCVVLTELAFEEFVEEVDDRVLRRTGLIQDGQAHTVGQDSAGRTAGTVSRVQRKFRPTEGGVGPLSHGRS